MMYRDTFQSQRSFSLGEVATANPPIPITLVFLNNVTNSKLFSNFKLSDYNGLFFSQKIGYLVIKRKVFPAAVKPHNSTPAYVVIQIVKCKTMGKTIFPHSGKR